MRVSDRLFRGTKPAQKAAQPGRPARRRRSRRRRGFTPPSNTYARVGGHLSVPSLAAKAPEAAGILTQQRPVLPDIALGCRCRPVPTCPVRSQAGSWLRAPGPATQVGEKPVSRTVYLQNRARKTGLFGGIDGARQGRSASVQRNRPKFGGPRRGRHM